MPTDAAPAARPADCPEFECDYCPGMVPAAPHPAVCPDCGYDYSALVAPGGEYHYG